MLRKLSCNLMSATFQAVCLIHETQVGSLTYYDFVCVHVIECAHMHTSDLLPTKTVK